MLKFLTAGESHGKGLVGILEGLPSGLRLDPEELASEMRRRKLGYGRGARQKIEDDLVEIVSGIRRGFTLGSPVGLLIWNRDWSSWKDVLGSEPMGDTPAPAAKRVTHRPIRIPRPGHADLVGGIKYAHEDLRNVLERASARETAMRVALGACARFFLRELGIEVMSHVTEIGDVKANVPPFLANEAADRSAVRTLDPDAEAAMVQAIEKAKKDGDTLGGIFEVVVTGAPIGLGSYSQWNRRIEGALAQALMSLNAIKGVEVGLGFEAGRVPGSEAHDEYVPGPSAREVRRAGNRAGGIEGGMTTGEPLVLRVAMKPLATLMSALQSVDLDTGEAAPAHVERSDVCAVPAAAVIGESLVALTLADFMLEKFGGDSMREIADRVARWRAEAR